VYVVVVGVGVPDGNVLVLVRVQAHAAHHVLGNVAPVVGGHGFTGWQGQRAVPNRFFDVGPNGAGRAKFGRQLAGRGPGHIAADNLRRFVLAAYVLEGTAKAGASSDVTLHRPRPRVRVRRSIPGATPAPGRGVPRALRAGSRWRCLGLLRPGTGLGWRRLWSVLPRLPG